VTAVEGRGGAFTIRTAAATLSARAVVAAIPPRAAARLVVHLASRVAESLQALRAADTAVVLLGYRREDVTHRLDGYGLLVPRSEGLRTTACGFFSTKFPGRAPEGHVLLRAFLGGARDPDILGLDDHALVATATSDLRPVLGLQKPPVLAKVFRWPQATPQLEVGHGERMSTLDRQLAGTPGLFLTGAGLRATGIPDCIADATATAARAASFLGRSSAAILGP
jgi:oxygen-dependent protoporphyrinogen oxidase